MWAPANLAEQPAPPGHLSPYAHKHTHTLTHLLAILEPRMATHPGGLNGFKSSRRSYASVPNWALRSPVSTCDCRGWHMKGQRATKRALVVARFKLIRAECSVNIIVLEVNCWVETIRHRINVCFALFMKKRTVRLVFGNCDPCVCSYQYLKAVPE